MQVPLSGKSSLTGRLGVFWVAFVNLSGGGMAKEVQVSM
jgi:hypothetical protein